MTGLFGSIRILADPHMPGRYQWRFPEKGPYYQRRQRKFARDARNWRWPDKPFVILGGDCMLCNPDYLPVLKETLRAQNVRIA
jgi:hypothetical protein